MNGVVRQRPQAKLDVVEIAERMSLDNLQAALDFIDAAERTFQSLAQMPGMAPLWEQSLTRFPGMRVWPIPKFPKHLVFYRPLPDGIEVIRVSHGARKLERLFE